MPFVRTFSLFTTYLASADLVQARLAGESLREANLSHAQLEGASLSFAQLEGADLTQATPEDAVSLKNTNMHGVIGLTPEQYEMCIKKGAIYDDIEQTPVSDTSSSSSPPPVQGNDAQAPSAPPAQGSTSPSGTGRSGATSSQLNAES